MPKLLTYQVQPVNLRVDLLEVIGYLIRWRKPVVQDIDLVDGVRRVRLLDVLDGNHVGADRLAPLRVRGKSGEKPVDRPQLHERHRRYDLEKVQNVAGVEKEHRARVGQEVRFSVGEVPCDHSDSPNASY
ncbi:MAG TPA: hypothetical protein VMV69_27800 [Pirellulales bacterium]|nr:hypothetical protein [Pirellulales bacterium]